MSTIKLTKLSGGSDSFKVNDYKIGRIVGGVFPIVPTVGKPFFIENCRTGLVQEILSPNTFRTYNSVYKWEVVKP
jgi:hypothetical protein